MMKDRMSIVVIFASAILCQGCGGTYQTREPGGELVISPASFKPGVYQGTYSGSLGLDAASGNVIWYHTTSDADRLIIVPGSGPSRITTLTIGQNSSSYLVDATFDAHKMSFGSFQAGSFHGETVGGSPITVDLAFQHP